MSTLRNKALRGLRAKRRFRRITTLLAAFCLSWQPGLKALATEPFLQGYFQGQAVAVEAQANIGPVSLQLGNASVEQCPCRGSNGQTLTNTVASLIVGPAGTIATAGVNRSTSYGVKTASLAVTKQTTAIASLNLLNGLITADSLTAVAQVRATASAITPTSSGSKFLHLKVAGVAINDAVAQNTNISLPGVGLLTLNFVSVATNGARAAGIEVEMLRLQITQASNPYGLSVGALLVVGEAFAGFDRMQPPVSVSGFAETLGVTANAPAALTEAAGIGSFSGVANCIGTGGTTLTDTAAALSVAGLIQITSATTTSMSNVTATSGVVKMTSTINKSSLLGLITVDAVTAVAQETSSAGVSTASAAGSSFAALTVAGTPITGTVAPNTVIYLPSLGYVVLNEQVLIGKNSLQVNGLHIVVTASNAFDLPIGTELILAHADATAAPFQ